MAADKIAPRIIVDTRELNSSVGQTLALLGADVDLIKLEVGDYQLSQDCYVERKTTSDLLYSITGDEDKLFRQIHDLVKNFRKPLLLIEGDLRDLFTTGMSPNAVWAIIRTIIWNGCPIMVSKDEDDSARMLYDLAVKEQSDGNRSFSPHGNKTKRTPDEQKVYTVSSLEGVGPETAKALLQYFGTVQTVFSASEQNLMAVDGVGPKTAKQIRDAVSMPYFGKK